MNRRKQGKKNPTISKSFNPTTDNDFKALDAQHDEHATGEDGAPPATKRLHLEIQKGKKVVESSKNKKDDPSKQPLHPKESTHCSDILTSTQDIDVLMDEDMWDIDLGDLYLLGLEDACKNNTLHAISPKKIQLLTDILNTARTRAKLGIITNNPKETTKKYI